MLPRLLANDTEHQDMWVFLFGALEVLRRVMWNFFRLENEQLHNIGGFRAVQEVPLPFHHDKDFQERLEQVNELKKAAAEKVSNAHHRSVGLRVPAIADQRGATTPASTLRQRRTTKEAGAKKPRHPSAIMPVIVVPTK